LRLAAQVATGQVPGTPALLGTSGMYVGMSEIHRERNDLKAARQDLHRSQELGEHAGLPQNRYRWWVAMSRIKQSQGDLEGALEALHQAERVFVVDIPPNVRPIAALRARVWVAQGMLGRQGIQGRLVEAEGWAQDRGLSVMDDLSYLREFEHITLARLLLAQYKSNKAGEAEHRGGGGDRTDRSILEATGLLERLLPAAQEGGRRGSVIEILVLQALAHQMQGALHAALMGLERALLLAEPEGYVRIFVDEGLPMAVLLEEAAKHNTAPSYVHRLLAALGQAEGRTPVKQGLIEPLSVRELEVLRLLRTELTGPEIARELSVSLHTMRTHTNNIYYKLGMNNRRRAVRRAEELGLL
jgi:LuxR family maltose regulon positive regulatory protein